MPEMTDDVKYKIPIWQRKCLDNTITPEEMCDIVNHLREGRTSALELGKIKRAASGKRKPKEKADAGADLLADFEALLGGGNNPQTTTGGEDAE